MTAGCRVASIVWVVLALTGSAGVRADETAGAEESVEAADFRWSQPIAIDRPGWQRVGLGARLMGAGPIRSHLTVTDPDGRALPYRLLGSPRGFVTAHALSVDDSGEGFVVIFDLGPAPLRHQRFELESVRNLAARGCRLDGSDDLETWSPLTQGDLFRIGARSSLMRSALDYAPTTLRYLRLHWPRTAGLPEFRQAGVEAGDPAPGDPQEIPLDIERLAETTLGTRYRLTLPGAHLPIRRLRVSGELGTAWRLFAPDSRTFSLLGTGVTRGAAELTVDDLTIAGGTDRLRLDLLGAAGTPRRLDRAFVDVSPLWIVFHAARTGDYTLLGGHRGDAGFTPGDDIDARSIGPVVERVPSEARAIAARPFSSRWAEPIPPPQSLTLAALWPLHTQARPGDVTSLSLPPELMRDIEGRVEALRLIAGDRELPFIVWTAPEPELVVDTGPMRVPIVPGEAESRLSIARDELLPRPTLLELWANDAPADRSLRMRFPREARPGVDAPAVEAWGRFSCLDADPAPCRAEVGIAPAAEDRYELILEDVERSGPTEVALLAWRPSLTLLFVWPEGEAPLLARLQDRGQPVVYRLQQEARALSEAPRQPAQIRMDERRTGDDRRQRLLKVAFYASLAIAAGLVLYLLVSALRTKG